MLREISGYRDPNYLYTALAPPPTRYQLVNLIIGIGLCMLWLVPHYWYSYYQPELLRRVCSPNSTLELAHCLANVGPNSFAAWFNVGPILGHLRVLLEVESLIPGSTRHTNTTHETVGASKPLLVSPTDRSQFLWVLTRPY